MGAGGTAAVHLVLLAPNYEYVGVSHGLLLGLGFVALAYNLFSWFSWHTWPQGNKLKLLIIAAANTLFCAVTLSILFIHWNRLSNWVILYWLLEAAIIAAIVVAELSIRKRVGVAASEIID